MSALAARLDAAELLYPARTDTPPRGLHATTLDVRRGERLALIGANGCGKSTVLRLLATLATPTAGAVEVLGTTPRRSTAPRVRRRLAVCLPDVMLDPLLTAGENLDLSGRLAGLSRGQTRARVERLADALGLADRLGDRVARLSTGLRRRVDLARTLLHDADLLLLDEPSSSLDERASAGLAALLEERESAGAATVLVSHDAGEALRAARLACLLDGRLVAVAEPAAVASRLARRVVRWQGAEVDTAGAVAWRAGGVCTAASADRAVLARICAALDAAGGGYSAAPAALVDVPAMLLAEGAAA